MQKAIITTIAVSCLAIASCRVKPDAGQVSYTGEQAIVYKTWKDYRRNVPVTLNAARTEIIAYPAPGDLYRNGQLAYPSRLSEGFLLDNRGISPNSAFLSLTYEEYAKLAAAPPLSEMMGLIEDKEPFVAIYNLGNRSSYKNEITELNSIISKGRLGRFKRVK
jgi:hypothetical protein